jgi:hypothetical protein
MTNGPALLNCKVAASSGTTLARITPRNDIKLRKPLAIPSATAPCIPIASKTATVTAARKPTNHFSNPPHKIGYVRDAFKGRAKPRVNVVFAHKHKKHQERHHGGDHDSPGDGADAPGQQGAGLSVSRPRRQKRLFSRYIEYHQPELNNPFNCMYFCVQHPTQPRLHKSTHDLLGLALFKIQGKWYVNLRGDLISITCKHLRGLKGPNVHMR